MGYKRKTEHGVSDYSVLLKAVKEIKNEKKSIRATSKTYNIPKTSLLRYVRKVNSKFDDISRVTDAVIMDQLRCISSNSIGKHLISFENVFFEFL